MQRVMRYHYTSLLAAFGMLVVFVAPVIAIEAMLLALLLVVTGASNYWPTNLVAALLGTGGAASALHGILVRWQTPRGVGGDGAVPAEPPERIEDGSGGLVALVVTALAAAIVGALP